MNENIKFSVTVPAYKAQFLAECIDSILSQTYKNFELIIVNDASPQELDSIVEKYNDPRIHYYKNKVGFGAEHVVSNWNKCLEYATGDYLICMGDDDKLLPNCLKDYSMLIEKYPGLGLYHTQTLIINEQSEIIRVQPPRPIRETLFSLIYYRWFGGRPQYIGDWLFEVDFLRKNGGFVDLPYAWEADDMTAYVTAQKGGVANVQMPGFLYRINSQTISSSTNNTGKKLQAHLLANKIYDKLLANQPNDKVDDFYKKVLIHSRQTHINKAFRIDLSADISGSVFRFLTWFFKKKKYAISNKTLIKAFITSIIIK